MFLGSLLRRSSSTTSRWFSVLDSVRFMCSDRSFAIRSAIRDFTSEDDPEAAEDEVEGPGEGSEDIVEDFRRLGEDSEDIVEDVRRFSLFP